MIPTCTMMVASTVMLANSTLPFGKETSLEDSIYTNKDSNFITVIPALCLAFLALSPSIMYGDTLLAG